MPRNPIAQRPKGVRQDLRIDFILRQGGFRRDRASRGMGKDGAVVDASGEVGESRSQSPIARRKLALADRGKWPTRVMPSAASLRCRATPTPHSNDTGLSAKNA